MPAKHYALIVAASFHGQVVEERYERGAGQVQIGRAEGLAVPVPEGLPYVARIIWASDARCIVEDGLGHQHVLEPDHDVRIALGPVSLRLYLAEQFPIRRLEGWSVQASLAWFTVVLAATVLSMQGGWWQNPENHCQFAVDLLPTIPDVAEPLLWLFGPIAALVLVGTILVRQAWREAPTWAAAGIVLLFPGVYTLSGAEYRSGDEVLQSSFYYCLPQEQQETNGGALSAEYLARLLREDYDGDDDGALKRQERAQAEKEAKRVYLPAGNEGPITNMGGAADTARDAIRTPDTEEIPVPKQRREEEVPLYAKDVGEPIDAAELPDEVEEQDGTTDAEVPLEVDSEPDELALDLPAEEEEGWGIQDWYDERDQAMEALEIELMMAESRRRLKINPNDPGALSILSYYQYLAQSYDDAIETYDKYIELYPDDAAGYNNKALVYKRLEEYGKEEALYRVALSLEPLDVTAMNNLAVNLSHQGKHDEAIAVMKQLEQLDPNDPYADLHRAKIYAQLGETEAALDYLDKALQGMKELDTLHHIEFRQDIRIDPSFESLRQTQLFRGILKKYYGDDSPLQE